MSEDSAPERIGVIWSPEARADLRAIEREIAMQILRCIDRYLMHRNATSSESEINRERRRGPIMRQTRHKSLNTLRKYTRDCSLFQDNRAAKLGL